MAATKGVAGVVREAPRATGLASPGSSSMACVDIADIQLDIGNRCRGKQWRRQTRCPRPACLSMFVLSRFPTQTTNTISPISIGLVRGVRSVGGLKLKVGNTPFLPNPWEVFFLLVFLHIP